MAALIGNLLAGISGHQSVDPSRDEISVLSGKYKTFEFVHRVNCREHSTKNF